MESINVTDPKTGLTHAIPFDQLPHALEAGGQFSDESQKSKAIQMQQGRSEAPSIETPASKESTGIFGIASDAATTGSNLVSEGIDFALDYPEEWKKSMKLLFSHPARAALDVAGRGGEIAKAFANSPRDILAYLGRKEIIPESIGKHFPAFPEDLGIEHKLGLDVPQEGDRLFRAAADVATLQPLVKGFAKLFKAPDLTKSIKKTQAKVNEANAESGKVFDIIEEEVGKRGLSKIPINRSVIDQSESYLAKTPATRALIKRAKTGNYEALRQLQADLRVKAEKALGSRLASENVMGEEILATRDEVNSAIENHLENTGQHDLAKALKDNRNKYREIQDVYFSTPALAKVFGKSQKVPKDVAKLLTEDSVEMNKFMAANPEMKKALAKALSHKKKVKAAKVIGSIAGTGTAVDLARRAIDSF